MEHSTQFIPNRLCAKAIIARLTEYTSQVPQLPYAPVVKAVHNDAFRMHKDSHTFDSTTNILHKGKKKINVRNEDE